MVLLVGLMPSVLQWRRVLLSVDVRRTGTAASSSNLIHGVPGTRRTSSNDDTYERGTGARRITVRPPHAGRRTSTLYKSRIREPQRNTQH